MMQGSICFLLQEISGRDKRTISEHFAEKGIEIEFSNIGTIGPAKGTRNA